MSVFVSVFVSVSVCVGVCVGFGIGVGIGIGIGVCVLPGVCVGKPGQVCARRDAWRGGGDGTDGQTELGALARPRIQLLPDRR